MKQQRYLAYIGLGANLELPENQIASALVALAKIPRCRLVSHSSNYRSVPLGPPDQNDYINAVAAIETDLTAPALLRQLQGIEDSHGRVRNGQRWGPRILDLDLLLYNNEKIQQPSLIVPHPELKFRNFVLFPLFEIASDLILPDGTSVRDLVNSISSQGIRQL